MCFAFLHTHVSFAVIAYGWLQALKVAGVLLITAKRGGQAHLPQTSPLDIFMFQVGLTIFSSHLSQSHLLLLGEAFISHYALMQIIQKDLFKLRGCENVTKSYFYTAHNCSGIYFSSYCIFTFFYLPLQPSLLPPSSFSLPITPT